MARRTRVRSRPGLRRARTARSFPLLWVPREGRADPPLPPEVVTAGDMVLELTKKRGNDPSRQCAAEEVTAPINRDGWRSAQGITQRNWGGSHRADHVLLGGPRRALPSSVVTPVAGSLSVAPIPLAHTPPPSPLHHIRHGRIRKVHRSLDDQGLENRGSQLLSDPAAHMIGKLLFGQVFSNTTSA